ncbi:tryptophan synthase subunit alpha [Oceanobacillus damuensis]|uniref:tryptophan synthase subunit alpha n=1 Tax=Oceanobacillus damuensis TaxID=937928 RepID=UPI00082C722C|nr:tryptophan synthase subunit alpha [Oceanobacillus damuensis]
MGKAMLEETLQEKIKSGENIFVPYIMAGDGGLDILEERINFLQECGASAIEVGIPFSDPVADGPIIQEAGIRALDNGTTLAKVLETLQAFKANRTIPIIVMTYLNPVFVYGVDRFAKDCTNAGVDGVIIPDLPMEEEHIISQPLSNHEIAFVRLAAMTSPKQRLTELAKRSEGFLYAVAVNGTTGARTSHDDKVQSYLKELKEHAEVPVLAGFGVSTTEQAHALSNHCDGVIVGSKIVQLLHEGRLQEIHRLIEGSILAEVSS